MKDDAINDIMDVVSSNDDDDVVSLSKAANAAPIVSPSVELCNASPNELSNTADEHNTLH